MALTVWNDKTVSGQYAGLVAANWKGQTYIRSAPSKVNNNSPAQQAHKQAYKLIYTLFNPLYDIFIKPNFHAQKMTPMNTLIKAQAPKYWKSPQTTQHELNLKTRHIKFPIQTLMINVDIIFEPYSQDIDGFPIASLSITGQDKDIVENWYILINDIQKNEIYIQYGSMENPPTVIKWHNFTGGVGSSFIMFSGNGKHSNIYHGEGDMKYHTPLEYT